jgi:hypothetical protein
MKTLCKGVGKLICVHCRGLGVGPLNGNMIMIPGALSVKHVRWKASTQKDKLLQMDRPKSTRRRPLLLSQEMLQEKDPLRKLSHFGLTRLLQQARLL